MKKAIILIFLSITLFSCTQKKESADLIIIADRIYTVDSSFNMVEAMAIKDGRILATGSEKFINNHYTSTHLEKMDGYIYPGFIDAHSHFYGYGMTTNRVNLKETYSMEEIIQKVVAFAETSTEDWVTGRGWDETDWIQKGRPNNIKLSLYFPDRPVFIKRVDGHAAIANRRALELAGITPNTVVLGGTIEVENGYLTGLLTDNAMDLVEDVIPEPSRATNIQSLINAQKDCFEQGLTCVCDAGLDLSTLLLIDSLQRAGDLKIRVYAMANPSEENFDYFEENGPISNDFYQVSSFKLYADGALGSRGAKLKENYCDDDHAGVWVTLPQELKEHYEQIYKMGFQANTHCIGDSANKMVLEQYAAILQGANDRRWRIEHSQIVSPEDRHLFKDNNIIPSVQPTHATSDMPWVKQRICSHRMDGAYAYKSLLSLNGYMPLGTDFPVEHISPLETFYAAVYRKNTQQKPVGGFLPEESLSAREALSGMTTWAAKGNFMEDRIGSLVKGKLADFVVLDQDILVDKYMLNTKVLATYLSGEQVN